MKGAVSNLELLRPRRLEEALTLLSEHPGLTPVAGGTDLYVLLNFGMLQGTRFLDVWELDELRDIHDTGGMIRIGALASYTSIIRSRAVRARLPMLVAAAREIGGIQIQNRGTLGGNIANGSPAGDTLPVLMAADAIVVLRSLAGERKVPLVDFYAGYRKSVMRQDELITAVEVEHFDGRQWFRKVGTRAAQAISKIVMAAVRTERPRVAIGSVAPVPLRVPRTEAALAAGASSVEARLVLESEISPIDDIRSTAAYRRKVAGNLLERFWEETASAGA